MPGAGAGRRSETGYAKINLALHVRERLDDGYHRIETVFAFCDDGDELSIEPSEDLSLEIIGPFAGNLANDGDNLVIQAARSVDARGSFTLHKSLPVASGIGGGSADAAAALRLLGFGDSYQIARRLGADVPACLASKACLGEGRGDVLRPLDLPELAGQPVLLVNPGTSVSTAAIFSRWDGIDRGPLTDWRSGRNDLADIALRLVPELRLVLDSLGSADVARMSGSGATCFGLYASEAARDCAAQEIGRRFPHWWTLQTRLRP